MCLTVQRPVSLTEPVTGLTAFMHAAHGSRGDICNDRPGVPLVGCIPGEIQLPINASRALGELSINIAARDHGLHLNLASGQRRIQYADSVKTYDRMVQLQTIAIHAIMQARLSMRAPFRKLSSYFHATFICMHMQALE